MSIIGRAQRDGVSVAVAPGGALRNVQLEPVALQQGGAKLASTILALVREATGRANREAEAAIREQADGLSDADFAALGLASGDETSDAGRR
ncbi:YbaB/EbfC family DNA-binding protein [Saccharopolyspora indica]|uniref:YbaB/EbfC family DNA-binding protein n=1 Tax=Saccharopolyspora indica TaxID=1229659 RepID=UPI0022EAC9A2|nr:YbaB/EbfC family DNA-binding protein [Saccharopolyspora indica]MDA3645653.1 YbaB/EbfC family DNA-binding protein [Saccharopolyspora indica]